MADNLTAESYNHVDESPVLTPERPSYYRITALGPAGGRGDSVPSNAVVARLPAAVPIAPTGVAAFPGRTTIQLEWAAPVVAGDTPVHGYRIEHAATEMNPSWQPLIADTGGVRTYFLDPNPPAGTRRYYRIAALNRSGLGAWSETVSGITDDSRPAPPQNLRLRMQGTTVELRWDASATAGAPGDVISGYRVDRATDGGNTWHILVNSTETETTVYVDTSAPAGARATYRIFARNGITAADLSLPAGYAAITVVGAWPPWPRNLVVEPRVRRHLLTWRPVQSDGGRSVTGYRVEAAQHHERAHPLWEEVATVNDAAITNHVRNLPTSLNDGTNLLYRIVTLTGGRESEYSALVVAPVHTAVGRFDFNGDSRFDRNDARLMYYTHTLGDAIGDGTLAAGLPGVREELLEPLGTNSDDEDWRNWIKAARGVTDPSLDFNGTGMIDALDAQLLLYQLDPTLESALTDATGRRVFLHPLVPEVKRTDAALLEILGTINFLRGLE